MTTPPSEWQRTTTRRFLKWLFSWRTMRRMLIGLACLVTIWALFCTEENIRGKHAWDSYRRELEDRGEQLDYKAFIPKPIPDEQNFAATPLIKSWFVRSNNVNIAYENWKNDNYGLAEADVTDGQPKSDSGNRHFVDLVAWGTAFDAVRSGTLAKGHKIEAGKLDRESRAKAVPSILEALRTDEAVFAELRAASPRPYSRYPVNWEVEDPFSILLPHLGSVRNVCRRLQLKACAELAAGHSDDALADVKLILRLTDSLREEPFLISYLVRVACLQLATDPVWEGLAEHAWSDAQLQELEVRFQPYNFAADLKWPFDAERAAGIAIIDWIRKGGKLSHFLGIVNNPQLDNPQARLTDLIVKIAPTGWYDQEQLNYCRLFGLQLAGTYDGASKRVYPSRVQSDAHQLDQAFAGRNPFDTIFVHHRLMSTILLPALGRIPLKGAIAQTASDQAVLACALERYRLSNGQFPDTLDALAPQFVSQLPHDVITGDPYKYRRTDDGQFVLYSVGWNEKDDGGVPGKILFDDKDGDWVWQYPPLR